MPCPPPPPMRPSSSPSSLPYQYIPTLLLVPPSLSLRTVSYRVGICCSAFLLWASLFRQYLCFQNLFQFFSFLFFSFFFLFFVPDLTFFLLTKTHVYDVFIVGLGSTVSGFSLVINRTARLVSCFYLRYFFFFFFASLFFSLLLTWYITAVFRVFVKLPPLLSTHPKKISHSPADFTLLIQPLFL